MFVYFAEYIHWALFNVQIILFFEQIIAHIFYSKPNLIHTYK